MLTRQEVIDCQEEIAIDSYIHEHVEKRNEFAEGIICPLPFYVDNEEWLHNKETEILSKGMAERYIENVRSIFPFSNYADFVNLPALFKVKAILLIYLEEGWI